MSCASCGNTGSCNCSSVTIPSGADGEDGAPGVGVTVVAEPAGPNCLTGGVKITDGNGIITYVCNGLTGVDGDDASPIAKYANTFTINGSVDPIPPITISKAAIISCEELTNTCASTPRDFDFSVTIWYQNASSQWTEVTNLVSYIESIIYDTTGNQLTIQTVIGGVFRVVIQG